MGTRKHSGVTTTSTSAVFVLLALFSPWLFLLFRGGVGAQRIVACLFSSLGGHHLMIVAS